jgi:hypothetical protein
VPEAAKDLITGILTHDPSEILFRHQASPAQSLTRMPTQTHDPLSSKSSRTNGSKAPSHRSFPHPPSTPSPTLASFQQNRAGPTLRRPKNDLPLDATFPSPSLLLLQARSSRWVKRGKRWLQLWQSKKGISRRLFSRTVRFRNSYRG